MYGRSIYYELNHLHQFCFLSWNCEPAISVDKLCSNECIFSCRFGHGSAELENSLYVVGGHTAIAGVFPASPSVSLKQAGTNTHIYLLSWLPLCVLWWVSWSTCKCHVLNVCDVCRWSVTTPSVINGPWWLLSEMESVMQQWSVPSSSSLCLEERLSTETRPQRFVLYLPLLIALWLLKHFTSCSDKYGTVESSVYTLTPSFWVEIKDSVASLVSLFLQKYTLKGVVFIYLRFNAMTPWETAGTLQLNAPNHGATQQQLYWGARSS